MSYGPFGRSGAAIDIRGQKPDWLSDGLDAQPGFFVTGVRRRLIDEVFGRVSIRSIAHWPRGAQRPYGLPGKEVWIPPYNVFMRHLLCVAVSSTKDMQPAFDAIWEMAWAPTRSLRDMLGDRRALVVFSENDPEAPFLVADRTAAVSGAIDPDAYAAILNRERNDPARPFMKELNKGYADLLHYWSRHSLQANMSVCDLDAFTMPSSGVRRLLVELKSSDTSVSKLWPDDAPNLKLMEGLTEEFGAMPPLVVRSQPSRPGNVGFFIMERVDDDVLSGSYKVFESNDGAAALAWCVDLMKEISRGDTPAGLSPFLVRRR